MFIAHLLFTILVKNILVKTAFQEYYNEDIKIIYADDLKYLLAGVIVNYKK